MSYKDALIAAGAIVHAFKSFGSFQGDWYAKVEYNGRKGWIRDYYGSCSWCDPLEGEFENVQKPEEINGIYIVDFQQVPQDVFLKAQKEYDLKLASFGLQYLSEIITQEEAEKIASENKDWDMSSDEMLSFLKENSW